MDQDPRARLKQWLASGEARLQPLTFPQRELWENSPVPPGDPANHVCSFFEVQGPVTFDLCRDAVAKVVQRQEAMRTSFLPGKDSPLQIIRATGEPVIRYRELVGDERSEEGPRAVMEEGFREPFDFVRGPLYRLDMLRRGEDDHVLAFTIHHAVADGWTLGAFVHDLCAAYIIGVRELGIDIGKVRGLSETLSPLPMTYSEWGARERKRWQPEAIGEHTSYWKERLQGAKPLFSRGAGADVSEPLQKRVTELPEGLADGIRGVARESGCTLFSTLLAAFQATLNEWTGAQDIVVGTPIANRNKVAVAETMGYFSGVLPLRGFVDPAQPFVERQKAVHEQTMDDFAHAIPFAELAKSIGASNRAGEHCLFDVRFALQNHPMPDVELPGISTRLRTVSTGTVRFDLACELTEDEGGFELVWLHRPSVVSEPDLRELDALLRRVLAQACGQEDVQQVAARV